MSSKDRIQQLAVFYEAQDSTLKALGHDPRLRFLIGKDKCADDRHIVRCPALSTHPPETDVQALRGTQDRLAVLRRFGWGGYVSIAEHYDMPEQWHAELEQIRVEALACDYLHGVKADLQTYYLQHRHTNSDELFDDQRRQSILAYLRQGLAGLGESAGEPALQKDDQSLLDDYLGRLKAVIDQAAAFHQQVAELGKALGLTVQEPMSAATQLTPIETQSRDKETSSLHLVESENGEDVQDPAKPKDQESVKTVQAYHVFSRQFDEQCQANELADLGEQQVLRNQLDEAIREARPVMTRLAGRLLNTLYASTRTDWEQEQDDGLLETARLDRLIANPLYATPYRLPRRHDYRDTVVSLLMDNSGSMRGHPITVAAMCTDMLVRTLERCGVSVEVLGYTTADWRGGQARQQWVAAGKPPQPGRLNALRHIIYKSADQPWRRVRNALAVMLKQDLLKENIDGEALQWAWARLQKRQESRRILIVIADGAPSDEATNQANDKEFLLTHLRDVVQNIERNSEIELMAIGIGYDITGVYHNAVMIPAEGQLGDILITQLCNLFTYGAANTHTHRARRHGSVWSGAGRRSLML